MVQQLFFGRISGYIMRLLLTLSQLRLFSYAIDQDISVANVHSVEDMYTLFALPLSIQANGKFYNSSRRQSMGQLNRIRDP